MDIDIGSKLIETNTRGTPTIRNAVAHASDLTDLLCEYLRRHDPNVARRLIKLFNDCAFDPYLIESEHDNIEALCNYAYELITANYAIYVTHLKAESERLLESEKEDRWLDMYKSKLRDISDTSLMEAVLRKMADTQLDS